MTEPRPHASPALDAPAAPAAPDPRPAWWPADLPRSAAPETAEDRRLAAGLVDRRIAVVGYGNQGRAHARNLRDSGCRVVVGARAGGPGWSRAEADGFAPRPASDAVDGADLVVIGLPDELQAEVLTESVLPALAPEATVGFMHGFCVHHRLVSMPADHGVVLVAPKGPGDTLRHRFVTGVGIPALIAVHPDHPADPALDRAVAWARGLGCARARLVPTTFALETETDLFGEQAVLCGGVLALARTAFRTMIDHGAPPDLAYMECVQELKQVVDLIFEHGLAEAMQRISNTAELGAYEAADRLDASGLSDVFEAILADVRSGAFAARMMQDHEAGAARRTSAWRALSRDPIEDAGRAVRAWMPWLDAPPAAPDTPDATDASDSDS